VNRWQHGARPADRVRGQAMVEFALATILLLGSLVGFFDLARGIAAQHALSEMAWAGARYASMEACLGQRYSGGSPATGSAAGRDERPAPCPQGASSASTQRDGGLQSPLTPEQRAAIEAHARQAAFGIDASAATITIEFPDGGSRPGQRVRVVVTWSYVPVLSQFTGGRVTLPLQSSQSLLILR
jgi:hypothetical protein